jgi:hypothetical protein
MFTAFGLAVLFASPVSAQGPSREERIVQHWTSPDLVTFTGEPEFRRYLTAIKSAVRARGGYWGGARQIQFAQVTIAQVDTAEPLCPDADPACMGDDAAANIVVTGARVASNPTITNNQEAGVDEGDIVKQVGQFLLVLQDGRIFSIDTRAGGGGELALVDRIDVYRNPRVDTWYDEMLVQGDRIIVTGYSYNESASEITVLRIDPRGRLTRQGTFYLSSSDYYDTENYATRIVGDRLVVYTPMWLGGLNPLRPVPWPVVRRWVAEEQHDENQHRGDRLFEARSIYRPVRDTFEPIVHTISVCPLGPPGEGRDLSCRTTAFVGPQRREFYVTPDSVYLWISADEEDRVRRDDDADDETCPADGRLALADTARALLYRVPLSGDAPEVLGTAGVPIDQFSFLATGGRFHALLRWPAYGCDDAEEGPTRLMFFRSVIGRLGEALTEAPAAAYTPAPSVGTNTLENRFTDTHLVYGGRNRWYSGAPDDETEISARAAVLPIERAGDARVLDVPHSIIRAERAGDDIVLTGYRDETGLRISLIDIGVASRLTSTAFLPRRFESEGRSHAFNSLIERDGSGLMGLPTVIRRDESGRWWWRSDASDVSFLSVDRAGQLASIGELTSSAGEDADGESIPGYECEVSCVDWYGNSRPIFTEGRVFGLTGTELVEGRVENGRIRELRRLNIAVPAR